MVAHPLHLSILRSADLPVSEVPLQLQYPALVMKSGIIIVLLNLHRAAFASFRLFLQARDKWPQICRNRERMRDL
jgi:hypothetical protein